MDLLRIIAATAFMAGLPLTVILFIITRQKRREIAIPDSHAQERRRALRIVRSLGGPAIIRFASYVAAFVATMPVIVGGITILNPAQPFPDTAELASWLLWFVFGWLVFAWCSRITDALD